MSPDSILSVIEARLASLEAERDAVSKQSATVQDSAVILRCLDAAIHELRFCRDLLTDSESPNLKKKQESDPE